MREGESVRELFHPGRGGAARHHCTGTVLARLAPGTLVGEGSFFSGETRSATVTASMPGVAWALTWERFDIMGHKQPRLAIELTKGLAAVLAISHARSHFGRTLRLSFR
jgi:CRP/FNR family cyclic AMP-dependent transcriptional regulator